MSIYTFDTNYIAEKNIPPELRKPIRLAWLKVLLISLQKKHNDIFTTNSFKVGFGVNKWSSASNYSKGDITRYGIAVYEALVNNLNIPPNSDTVTWLLIEKDFVGSDARVVFNSGKMIFEFILNKYLNITPYTSPKIYITNNTIDVNSFLVGYDGDGSTGKAGVPVNQTDFIGTVYSLNQNAFTVYVPSALFTSLGNNAANREQTVRNVADKYVLAGIIYNVTTY